MNTRIVSTNRPYAILLTRLVFDMKSKTTNPYNVLMRGTKEECESYLELMKTSPQLTCSHLLDHEVVPTSDPRVKRASTIGWPHVADRVATMTTRSPQLV